MTFNPGDKVVCVIAMWQPSNPDYWADRPFPCKEGGIYVVEDFAPRGTFKYMGRSSEPGVMIEGVRYQCGVDMPPEWDNWLRAECFRKLLDIDQGMEELLAIVNTTTKELEPV